MLQAPGLARSLLVAADGEHNHIRFFGDLDGFGNLLAVFFRIAGENFVLIPRAAERNFAAFAVEHLYAVADLCLDAVKHGDIVFRYAAVAAEQAAMRIWADDRNGSNFLRIKRQ